MSDFRSDLKEMPFVNRPANSVSQLYDQYVHDLSRILDRHSPLVSSLKTKQCADWLSETYRLAKSADIILNMLGIKINDIHLSLSRGEDTALVLLDISAAFDTIDHFTFLSCLLDWFGVGGSALKWFSSYLTERYQFC